MTARRRVLIPVPSYGFDPTESGVPWARLASAGVTTVFATPDGRVAAADVRMVTGQDLPWFLRGSLMAQKDAVREYRAMEASAAFRAPLNYAAIDPADFDGLLLPGGHDKGMREYLESAALQRAVAWFFDHGRPVGAICHGTLLAARSKAVEDSARAGRSVLWGRKTTGLTRRQELIAWQLTRAWLGDYYRTYERAMADELIEALASPDDYSPGPGFPIPLARDNDAHLDRGYTVRDGQYVSARWPGDAHRFAADFLTLLDGREPVAQT